MRVETIFAWLKKKVNARYWKFIKNKHTLGSSLNKWESIMIRNRKSKSNIISKRLNYPSGTLLNKETWIYKDARPEWMLYEQTGQLNKPKALARRFNRKLRV